MFKHKNICCIISVITAIAWMIFGWFCMGDASGGLESADLGESIGTAIGMALMMPYLIVSSIGIILHVIGGLLYARKLLLAGLIVECVSIILGISWGFGLIISIVFGFVGCAKMKKM